MEIKGLINVLYQFKTVGQNEVGDSQESPITDGRPLPGIGMFSLSVSLSVILTLLVFYLSVFLPTCHIPSPSWFLTLHDVTKLDFETILKVKEICYEKCETSKCSICPLKYYSATLGCGCHTFKNPY